MIIILLINSCFFQNLSNFSSMKLTDLFQEKRAPISISYFYILRNARFLLFDINCTVHPTG